MPSSQVEVTVTDQTTYVDHFVRKKLVASLREKVDQTFQTRESGRHALFEVPTSEIKEVMIQPFEAALAFGGTGIAVPIGDTGVTVGGLGGSVKQQQWSGVSLVLADGQRILFKAFGPPVRVQSELAALMQFLHVKRPDPTSHPSTEIEAPDRYQQLRELASLRDEGILTDDEFAREKARLLDQG